MHIKKVFYSLPSLLPRIRMISVLFMDVEEGSFLFFASNKNPYQKKKQTKKPKQKLELI